MLGGGVQSVLDEILKCPPAPGHEAVWVPGQWEREHAEKLKAEGILLQAEGILLKAEGILLPEAIWARIKTLVIRQGITSIPHVEQHSTNFKQQSNGIS